MAMLGLCKRENGIDLSLHGRPTLRVSSPFRGVNAVVVLSRGLPVLLPCLLIGNAVADEWPELFDSGSVRYERIFENVSNDRGVMRSVMASKIDLSNGRSEGGAELGARGTSLLENLQLGGKPICYECANKCTNNGKAATNNRNVVSAYVFQGTKLQFWVALFSGFAVAVTMIVGVAALIAWRIAKPNNVV